MKAIAKLLQLLNKISPADTAYAHCDIPCGIYDPHHAQMAAHTVVRMMDLIKDHTAHLKEVKLYSDEDVTLRNNFIRSIKIKEDHAEIVKHEIRIIWGDYFKPEHLEKHKDLNDIVWKIMKLGSKCKQTVDKQAAADLLDAVNKFAEIFWETKNIKTKRVKAPYPTGKEMVVPIL